MCVCCSLSNNFVWNYVSTSTLKHFTFQCPFGVWLTQTVHLYQFTHRRPFSPSFQLQIVISNFSIFIHGNLQRLYTCFVCTFFLLRVFVFNLTNLSDVEKFSQAINFTTCQHLPEQIRVLSVAINWKIDNFTFDECSFYVTLSELTMAIKRRAINSTQFPWADQFQQISSHSIHNTP